MNSIKNDFGQIVPAIGSPASVERVRVEYPKLIGRLNKVYAESHSTYGRGVDVAIGIIRSSGIRSELETASLLKASDYNQEL